MSGGRGGGGRGGRGLGRGPGTGEGPGGVCVCTECGHEVPHVTGEPCVQRVCPKCGASMTRG